MNMIGKKVKYYNSDKMPVDGIIMDKLRISTINQYNVDAYLVASLNDNMLDTVRPERLIKIVN